ncbi:hypothetical protein B0T10DRAFT_100589 [Thelonectria olida]|uniref:RING-type domain-containing protein n=1 Tax=Thelonectria olida TaxID=1576542 RepID=A0A9P8WHM2_9HYPO|nr:hypothetical protein B0T10DRAFT_100589 [Thelonectria olida]
MEGPLDIYAPNFSWADQAEEAFNCPEQAQQEEPEGAKSPAPECYFPTIRRHLAGEVDTPIKASCPICFDDLNVPGLDEVDSGKGKGKEYRISPCGHMFCRSCIRQALKAQKAQNLARTCPVCRLPLSCRRCDKVTRFYRFGDDMKAHDLVQSQFFRPRRPQPDSPIASPTLPSSAPSSPTETTPSAEYVYICGRCPARDRWQARIRRREWPESAMQLEPGVVDLVYHILDSLEDLGRWGSREAVMDAIEKVMDDEFAWLAGERESFILEEMSRRGGEYFQL